MTILRRGFARLACLALLALYADSVLAQQLLNGPRHDSGQSITGAYEGWFKNPDGTFSLLFGYYNRNLKQELDIPVGPDNSVQPAVPDKSGPDRGQPTHFLPGRKWGVFTVTVPPDFGSGKLTWTMNANGARTTIPASLNPLWELAPFKDATGNTPPFIGFSAKGPFVQGPRGQSTSLTAIQGDPLPLTLWVADDAHVSPGANRPKTPPVAVTLSKFRGPGAVTFASPRPPIEAADFESPAETTFRGKASTTATFSEPGDYILHILANDWTGEGGQGFQCCWSNAYIRVNVK